MTSEHFPVEIEHEVVVAGLLYPECAAVFEQMIRPEYFSDPRYAALAAELLDQLRTGDGVNPALVARNLKSHSAFPGGNDDVVAFIQTLEYANRSQFPKNCAAIVEASRKRDMVTDLHQLQYMARNGDASTDICRATLETVSKWRQAAAGFGQRGPTSFGVLRNRFPKLRPPVIDELAREGEILNIISTTKIGKSWFVYPLLLCVIVARLFLNRFAVKQGKALLIDTELHEETLAYRIQEVAAAMGIEPHEYEDDLVIWALRGKQTSLDDITAELMQFEPGEFKLVVWDSKYRVLRPGAEENSNDDERDFYNALEPIGDHTRAVQALVHHSSKGDQSQKRTTDVGAGGGAQSRACDTHLVMREHEQPGLVVVDTAIRSFKPLDPFTLRWEFPLWLPDDSADPARLKRQPTGNQVRQEADDRKGMELIIKALRGCPATARQLREKTGLGKDRQQRLLDRMVAEGHATTQTINVRGNDCNEYHIED